MKNFLFILSLIIFSVSTFAASDSNERKSLLSPNHLDHPTCARLRELRQYCEKSVRGDSRLVSSQVGSVDGVVICKVTREDLLRADKKARMKARMERPLTWLEIKIIQRVPKTAGIAYLFWTRGRFEE